jgi:hypothetical protein
MAGLLQSSNSVKGLPPGIEKMALSSQPDIRFLRNTGLTLVAATLVAGAIMLALVRTESKPVILADSSDGSVKELLEPVHLTAAGFDNGPIQSPDTK